MKPPPRSAVAVLLLSFLLSSFLQADTIRLRDGRELEGTIIAEDGDEYIAMIQVTRTIRDQRRIPKTEVLEIIGEKKDLAAFEEIRDLVPTPDGLDADGYDRRVGKVEDFIREFPESSLAKQAGSILATLDGEREIVAAGGVKFEGRMLAADERQVAAFTLDSRIAAADMDRAVESRRLTDALRAWDVLEKEFPTSRAFRDRLPAALSVMRAQLAAVERQLETIDGRIAERMANLDRIPDRDRGRVREAIDEETQTHLDRVAAEREAGIRWVSLDPFQKEDLGRTKSLLESEIRRLENLDTSSIPDGDTAWTEAWSVLASDPDPEKAREAVNNARTARLPTKYIEMLEARLPSN